MTDIKIYNKEALQHLLDDVPSNSVDLILTDPPYVTSRDSGMQKWFEKSKAGKFTGKTEEEWRSFKKMSEWKDFLWMLLCSSSIASSARAEHASFSLISGRLQTLRTYMRVTSSNN